MREEERPDRNWKFNSAERKMGTGSPTCQLREVERLILKE
jgi:hypothetical protein